MATNTTNFNLSKPAYTDTADIAVINSNMDKVDTALQGLGSGLAIVSNNNTHAAIAKNQLVYVHNHASLADGIYTAKSAIAANATLSSSNLTAGSIAGAIEKTAKVHPTIFENTTLNAIVATLNSEYGNTYCVQFTAMNLTDGNNSGPYIACRHTSFGTKPRIIRFNGVNSSSTDYVLRDVEGIVEALGKRAYCEGYALPANGTIYLEHHMPVMVFSDRGGLWTESSASRSLTTIAPSSNITVTRHSQYVLKIESTIGYGTNIVAIGQSDLYFYETPPI